MSVNWFVGAVVVEVNSYSQLVALMVVVWLLVGHQ